MATSTQITQIRRLVPGSTVFSTSTATIGWFVDTEPSLYYAAAAVAESCAATFGGKGALKVGDLAVDYQSGSFYRNLAKQLRTRGALGAVPIAGGITQSDKDAELADSNRIMSAFTIGMHDDPGVA